MAWTVAEWRQHHNHNQQLNGLSDNDVLYWRQVAIMLLGGENCIITKEEDRELAYDLFLCHICTMVVKQMVGVMASASEGSVSVSQSQAPNLSKSYLNMSPCGMLLYNLLSRYRMGMRWYPMPAQNGFR